MIRGFVERHGFTTPRIIIRRFITRRITQIIGGLITTLYQVQVLLQKPGVILAAHAITTNVAIQLLMTEQTDCLPAADTICQRVLELRVLEDARLLEKQVMFKDHRAEQGHQEKLLQEVQIDRVEAIVQVLAHAVNVTNAPIVVNQLHRQVDRQEVLRVLQGVTTELRHEHTHHRHLLQHHRHRHPRHLHHREAVTHAAEAMTITKVHAAAMTEAADSF
jgi:hypothetical protein